jgi:hypothetical protein
VRAFTLGLMPSGCYGRTTLAEWPVDPSVIARLMRTALGGSASRSAMAIS